MLASLGLRSLAKDADDIELAAYSSVQSPAPPSSNGGGGKDVPAAAITAASSNGSASDHSAPSARRKQFFSVTGMTCAACSGTIERALARVRGVHSARVSLLTERCEVVFDERVLSAKEIIGEIEDVGFDATLSQSSSKGKISLMTDECMNEDKRAVITRAVLEQTGVLNVTIVPRASAPYHDVLEVEFETDRHALTGPGGARPVVAQGPISADAAAKAETSLGRFSVRELVQALKQYNLPIAVVRNDGDLEARKAEIRLRRQNELLHWKRAFLYSLIFTGPIAALCWLAPLSSSWDAWLMRPVHRALPMNSLLMWILVTPVQFGFGWRFYRAGWNSLKHGSANMDVLVALGSSSAYFYSLLICILCLSNDRYEGNVFFETSALLITIVLLGRYVEHVAKGRTSEALSVLMGLQAATATLITLDPRGTGTVIAEEEVDVNLVQRDDLLLVHRGAKIPCDGVVESEDPSAVDEALLTGESMPVPKGRGDTVIGGTLNLESPLRVRATGVGSDTVLFKIVEMVQDAQSSKAPIQAYADFVSTIFVPVVVVLALFTFVAWYAACQGGAVPDEWVGEHKSPFLFSFLFSISVLLISCPCSLGLATPTAVMVGTGVGAALGVLFKGGEPLELTGKADVVVFDKTGTLTEGKPSVQRASTTILRREDVLRIASEKEWWALVGALAHESEHLMSRAIAAYAQQQQQENPLNPLQQQSSTSSSSSSSGANQQVVPFEAVARFEAVSGAGCRGEVKGRVIMIGNQRWLESQGVALSAEEIDVMDDVQTAGNIAVLVAIDGVLSGIVTLCDAVKAEAQGTVRALQARGIEVFMLTGDNARTARAVGALVGLDAEHVIAQVTPKDKGDVVKRIQLTGRKARSGDAQAYKGRMADERPLRVQPGLLKASKLHRPGGNPFAFTPPSSAATPNGSSASSAFLAVRESQALRSPTNGRHDSDAAERAAHEDDDIALLEEGGKAPASASDDADSVPLSDAVTVLMVGDGINDACSMAVADVGVAIGSGTDIAVETANVVLMRSDLTDVITAIDLSQATLKRIRRNFTWACIYNVMSIPVAAGVLFPVLHVGLPPILAAACMGLSSVSVIVSSLWLKRYRKPIVVDGEGPSGAPQQSATMRSTNIIKKVLSPGLRRNKDGATAGVAVRPSSSSASSSSLSSSSLPRNASALLSASVSQSGYTYAFAAVPHDGDEGEDEHEAVMREILAEGEQQQQQQKLLQAPSSAEEALTPLSPHSAQMAARKTSAASSPSSATAGMRAHRLPAPPVKAKASPSRR